MNKSDLIEILAKKIPNFSHRDVAIVVDTIFDAMTEGLIQGNRIEIRGFGSFEVRTRQPRMARNPKSGESVRLSTRKVPFFKVGKELKRRVDR